MNEVKRNLTVVAKLHGKPRATLGSSNFMLSVISLVLVWFNLNGAGIEDTGVLTGEIVAAVESGSFVSLGMLLFVNLWQPLRKMIKNGNFKFWNIFKVSGNFRTQIAVAVSAGLALLFGVEIPTENIAEFLGVLPSGSLWAILMSGFTHFGNTLLHFFLGDRGKPKPIPVHVNPPKEEKAKEA